MPAATTKRKRSIRAEDVLQGADLVDALDKGPADLHLPSGICAQYALDTVRQAVDTTAMTADFVIVTNERNRQGNSHQLRATKLGQGLRTDTGFDANPVVLFDHGVSGNPFPVATSSKVARTARQATATARFPERLRDLERFGGKIPIDQADDLLRNSAAIFAGVAEGLLGMASIGFGPIKAILREEEAGEELPQGVERMDLGWRGLHFVETELREWSIVVIGADRGALRQSLDRGKINDVPLQPFLRQSFQSVVDEVEEPETVPVSIDVSALGEQIQRLERAVDRLTDAVTQEQDEEEVDETDSEDESQTQVATVPQSATIPEPSEPELDARALAEAYLSQSEIGQDELRQLETALVGAIDQSIGVAAKAVDELERDLGRRLGAVT